MAKDMDKKVGQIRTFFKKNQPKNHPITDHPISECEEYVRGLYFDMLCVMAQYENDDTENQLRFIERIMAACEESMPIAEHIKRAMEINADKVTEFLKQCDDNDLNEIFFIDSLLIACANGVPNKKQVEFLAEIGDVMGFDKDNMDWLTKLAVSILEQDSDKYLEANSSYGPDYEEFFLEALTCYTKEYVSGCLISTSTHSYYYFKRFDVKPFFGDARVFSNKESVVFENQYINKAIRFDCVKSVEFRNCTIEDLDSSLYFNCVEKVRIENCIFRNCGRDKESSGGVFYFNKCTNAVVFIIDSTFSSCRVATTYIFSCNGGVAYSNERSTSIYFSKCEFSDCYAYYGAIVYGGSVQVDACRFMDCTASNYLFYVNDGYTGTDNKFIGCSAVHN